MKSDFTQPFKTSPAHIEVIVRDGSTGKYALLRSREEWEEEFCGVFHPKLNNATDTLQIVAYLDAQGFDVKTLRELARQTEVSYSFVDNTPGSSSDTVCILAVVNRTVRDKKIIEDQQVDWVDLGEFGDALHASPYFSETIGLALARLAAENYLY